MGMGRRREGSEMDGGIGLTATVYAVVYGLSGLRESIIDPASGHGYVRLQQ